MKFMLLIFLTGGVLQQTMAQKITILENYIWKNRIILLFAPESTNTLLQQQYSKFQFDKHGLKDRDLLIFQVLSDQIIGPNDFQSAKSAQELRNQYHIDKSSFCVILIGKDGSEKRRSNAVMDRTELYTTIDAMPMRRSEMRRKSEN